MPMHYFHMSNGHTILDDHGTDLPDLAAVRDEAVRAAKELMSIGSAETLWDGKPWKVWVTDAPNGTGRTVASIEMNGTGPA
jgi:hypothetical protein